MKNRANRSGTFAARFRFVRRCPATSASHQKPALLSFCRAPLGRWTFAPPIAGSPYGALPGDSPGRSVAGCSVAAVLSPPRYPGGLLAHAYDRFKDEGFVEGKAYASALMDETPPTVIAPLLTRIVNARSYEHQHRQYFLALWTRLSTEERSAFLSHLGAELDKELPTGRWWPLLQMLSALQGEGWRALTPRFRLRLEQLIVKNVLSGHVDIHRNVSLRSNDGSLGTYARSLWPYFSKPRVLADNIISLLHESLYAKLCRRILSFDPSRARRQDEHYRPDDTRGKRRGGQ